MQQDDWESAMWLIEDPEDFRARFDRIKKALENAREEYDGETAALLEKAETGELDRMINAETEEMESRTKALESRMDHLWGNDLEWMMPKKIGARLRTKWNLRRHTILWSVLHDMDENLMEYLDDAKDEGRLTEEEYARIWNTDLILKAFTWNGEHDEVWVALEISAAINDDDIERVAKSADIIQRALGKRAFASVAGYNIADPQIEKAEQADVKILHFS